MKKDDPQPDTHPEPDAYGNRDEAAEPSEPDEAAEPDEPGEPTQVPVAHGNRAPHKEHLNAHGRKVKALVAKIREKKAAAGSAPHDIEPELAQLDESGEILENFAWGE